jgi:aminopeptidase N
LCGCFSTGNSSAVHPTWGEGYRLLADTVIEIDRFSAQTAARMVGPLCQW